MAYLVYRLLLLLLLLEQIMLLTEDESTNHTERGSLDEMCLTDVATEATSVKQVLTTAHHQLVRLKRLAALCALLTTTKHSEIKSCLRYYYYYF